MATQVAVLREAEQEALRLRAAELAEVNRKAEQHRQVWPQQYWAARGGHCSAYGFVTPGRAAFRADESEKAAAAKAKAVRERRERDAQVAARQLPDHECLAAVPVKVTLHDASRRLVPCMRAGSPAAHQPAHATPPTPAAWSARCPRRLLPPSWPGSGRRPGGRGRRRSYWRRPGGSPGSCVGASGCCHAVPALHLASSAWRGRPGSGRRACSSSSLFSQIMASSVMVAESAGGRAALAGSSWRLPSWPRSRSSGKPPSRWRPPRRPTRCIRRRAGQLRWVARTPVDRCCICWCMQQHTWIAAMLAAVAVQARCTAALVCQLHCMHQHEQPW
jgi:hypothetical protein